MWKYFEAESGYWAKTFGIVAVGFLLLSAGSFLLLSIIQPKVGIPSLGPDPERARFMIECAYDWNLAPETCREILNGEDPPTLSPEYDGC